MNAETSSRTEVHSLSAPDVGRVAAESFAFGRTLKIEADGDFFKRRVKPKIRIMGYWLQRAGFPPGHRVCVTCVAPGIIELRSFDPSTVNDTEQASQGKPECPF